MSHKALTKSAVSAGTYLSSGSGQEQLVGEYQDAVLGVEITAVSGGSPTLTFVVKTRPQDGVNWYTLKWQPQFIKESDGTLVSSLVAVGRYLLAVPGPLGAMLRLDYVIGGATPSFTFGANWDLKS